MTLQQQASDMIYDLPDDSINLIIEIIKRISPKPETLLEEKTNPGLVFGVAKNAFYVDDDKFDAADDEVAILFGDST